MSWYNIPPSTHPIYVLVIKTNKYAGNFEREMCAYMTGVVGEYGVGEETACEQFNIESSYESPWFDKVAILPDEQGCDCPASVLDPPNHTSVGIAFHEKPSNKELQELKARAHAYCEHVNNSDYILHHAYTPEDPLVVEDVVWREYTVTVSVIEEKL